MGANGGRPCGVLPSLARNLTTGCDPDPLHLPPARLPRTRHANPVRIPVCTRAVPPCTD